MSHHDTTNRSRRQRLLSSVFAGICASASFTAAYAQAPAPGASTETVEEVLVTGSRLVNSNFTAPTPVTAIGAADIAAEAPANVSDFARALPSLQGTATASSGSTDVSGGRGGIAAMNLRSLGATRTLVLLDGQRSAPSHSEGLVDVNTFPQSLIERVEVVTGGASAAYGSDAVGGVVNFILNKTFTGLKGELEYGETTYGDGIDRRASLTYGAPFADGRGHVLISGEYAIQDGIHSAEKRGWLRGTTYGMPNTPANIAAGQPFYIKAQGAGSGVRTPGGLIVSGPLKGTYFGVGGSVNQFNYGDLIQGQMMRGGDYLLSLEDTQGSNSLLADEERSNIFGRVSYELTPGIQIYAQASHSKHASVAYYIQPVDDAIVIRADNAYLPASVRASMTQLNLASFTMGSTVRGFPKAGNAGSREADRLVLGADGEFDALGKVVKWDGYYQYGVTRSHEKTTQMWHTARLAQATDAVRSPSGAIVCRSTLTNPTNGCLPLNRIGINALNPAAIDWVFDEPYRDEEHRQDVFALNFSTNDFEGWAGPISLAAGLEHRREELTGYVPEEYKAGWKHGNFLPTFGKYQVTEGYVEAGVPIFEGLDLNAAGRYANYSISGGVKTWKVGLTYQPIDDVKFRMTRSLDIRAPNMSEFFSAGASRSNTTLINGVRVPFQQQLLGNPDLTPEEAKSIGVGVVVTPRFLPGFAASVDYYDIDIQKVITTVTAEQTTQFCYDNKVQAFCNNITFVNGVLTTIFLRYQNFDQLTTKGIDFEASYRTDLGPGSLSVRAMATHFIERISDNGVTAINEAGSNFLGSTPDWSYRATAIYNWDDWTASFTARGLSDGVLSEAFTECTSNCPQLSSPFFTIDDNNVEGAIYFDASISRDFEVAGRDIEVFFRVKNLLNKDPKLVTPGSRSTSQSHTMFPQTNRSLYDVLGRGYRAGIRFNF